MAQQGAASRRSGVLLPPLNASTYSLQVDPRFLHHGSSYLSAALEQLMTAQAGAGGHLVASTGSAALAEGAGRQRRRPPAPVGAVGPCRQRQPAGGARAAHAVAARQHCAADARAAGGDAAGGRGW